VRRRRWSGVELCFLSSTVLLRRLGEPTRKAHTADVVRGHWLRAEIPQTNSHLRGETHSYQRMMVPTGSLTDNCAVARQLTPRRQVLPWGYGVSSVEESSSPGISCSGPCLESQLPVVVQHPPRQVHSHRLVTCSGSLASRRSVNTVLAQVMERKQDRRRPGVCARHTRNFQLC